MAGEKENARDASQPTSQVIWIWVVVFWWIFLTLVSCPGNRARRYEEPERVSEHSSVVITLLLPELS